MDLPKIFDKTIGRAVGSLSKCIRQKNDEANSEESEKHNLLQLL